MNGPIRLALQVDPKAMTSPSDGLPDLLEADQFALSFMDAFAAIDDDVSEASSAEVLDLEPAKPEPIKANLDIPIVSPEKLEKPEELEVLPIAKVEYDIVEKGELVQKMVDEKPLSEEGKHPVEPLQRHAIVDDIQTRVSPTSDLQDTWITFNKREHQTLRSDEVPIKENAAQDIEDSRLKTRHVTSNFDLTKQATKQLEPKIGSAEESGGSPVRPLIQTSSIPLTAPPTAVFAMPTATLVMPNMVPIAPTVAPSISALNTEMDDQWVAKLSQDIGTLSADKSALSFQLKPNHLGKLHVEITTDITGDVVRLETDNENAKTLILGSQGRLEQDIRLSGIKLARVDVTLQEQSGSQFDQQGPDAQSRGTGLGQGRNGSAQGQPAEQISLPENTAPAASVNHGARYA